MEFQTTESFLAYLENIRARTMRVVRCIPGDRLDWACREGAFTLGDLMRHIATTERFVFAENVQGNPSRYPGCGKKLADGLDNVIEFMKRLHEESVEIFAQITDEELNGKATTPEGTPITRWKLLRAMVEHEIHHRGQIYLYLGMLGVHTPPLYGLTSEQLLSKAKPV